MHFGVSPVGTTYYTSLETSRVCWLTSLSLHRTNAQHAVTIISGCTILLYGFDLCKVKGHDQLEVVFCGVWGLFLVYLNLRWLPNTSKLRGAIEKWGSNIIYGARDHKWLSYRPYRTSSEYNALIGVNIYALSVYIYILMPFVNKLEKVQCSMIDQLNRHNMHATTYVHHVELHTCRYITFWQTIVYLFHLQE